MQSERVEIPCVIGGKDVRTGKTFESVMPHRKEHVLADVHQGGAEEVAGGDLRRGEGMAASGRGRRGRSASRSSSARRSCSPARGARP